MKTSDKKKLIASLVQLNSKMLDAEKKCQDQWKLVCKSNRKRASNLIHYLALRSLDIRTLQDDLHRLGLSSLASSESHIRGQLMAILDRLGVQTNQKPGVITYDTGLASIKKQNKALFGQRLMAAVPQIMVTLDTFHAREYASIKALLQSGMQIARINCSHDDATAWFQMIQHVKRASNITGLPCKIYMDLAGPKIRTEISGEGKVEVMEGAFIRMGDAGSHSNPDQGKISCTVPDLAEQLKEGDLVLFDDGLIEARVSSTGHKEVHLQITRVSSKKPYIKTEKGINFPDSNLLIPALTEYDRQCLPFIQKHADLVGYSFVRTRQDLEELNRQWADGPIPHLILKIETPDAVKNLPDLLLAGMQYPHFGVMIARGDLAVEIGFERMSEIQEEILWICEAAHVPVIWATQVLETLNKSGVATRSEVTDASHAAMADCVMINKGAFTIRVIETLSDILQRSGGHHVKKRYTFRPLSIASRFIAQQCI